MKHKLILFILLLSVLITTISAAQVCEIYDDFSSGSLDVNKWEVRQDYEGYPFIDEYGLDTGLQNFHTKQNNMGNAGTFLVPKHKFLPREVFEYDINYISGIGNRVSMLLINQQNRFGLLGYWNGPNDDSFGNYHMKLEFGENWIKINNGTAHTTSSNAPHEIYIGTRTGHNGLVHMDYDNFSICQEQEEPPQPESPCTGSNDELFCDDFESGNADKWMNQNGNWTIVNDNGNHFYRQSEIIGGGSHWRWAVAEFYGKDYSVEADMRYIEMGDFGMGFLMYSKDIVSDPSNDEALSLALYPRYNQVSLYVKESGLPVKEYIYSHSFEQNRWYNVKIEVQNELINISLDNQIVISNISTNILNEGYVLLNTDDLKADFDNIRVISGITQEDSLEERVNLLEERVDELENRTSLLESILNKIVEFIKGLPKGLAKGWNE